MTNNVKKYDPHTKRAIIVWACTNRKKCNYRIEK